MHFQNTGWDRGGVCSDPLPSVSTKLKKQPVLFATTLNCTHIVVSGSFQFLLIFFYLGWVQVVFRLGLYLLGWGMSLLYLSGRK